jgi:hypothetical protein
MGIQDKIEEIRRKPEHIRIRYVWMWVGISMVFIIAIWIISIAAQNKKPDASNQQLMEQFQDQKKSIEDTAGQVKNTFQQGQTAGREQNMQK